MTRAKTKPTPRPRAAKAKGAITPSKPDPIFAAIEWHRARWAALEKACREWEPYDGSPEDHESKVEVGVGHFMCVPSAVDNLVAGGLNDMWARFGKSFAAPLSGPIKRVGRSVKAALKAADADLEKRRDKTGYSAAYALRDAAENLERKALHTLVNTRPTTLAGLAALAEYSEHVYADAIEGGLHSEATTLLKTFKSAATKIHLVPVGTGL